VSEFSKGVQPPPNASADLSISPLLLPEMLSERCVHSLIGGASCRACIDACPRQAWVMDDEALGLAIDLCDGCGLCAPVCPEQAISVKKTPFLKLWKKSESAFFACEISGVESKLGVLPCLHSIGYRDILELYQLGVRTVALSAGNCQECVRGNGVQLSRRIETLNRVLGTTDSPPVIARSLTSDDWRELQQELPDIESGPRLSRRVFFSSLITVNENADSKVSELLGRQHTGFKLLGDLLPDRSESAPWPSVPSIDGALCTGCDTCVKLCPHSAILVTELEGQPCYRLEPGRCSGCRICVDVCEHAAVSVGNWVVQREPVVPLVELNCVVCGVRFHQPKKMSNSLEKCCPICTYHNHRKKLFQVID